MSVEETHSTWYDHWAAHLWPVVFTLLGTACE